MKRYTKFVAMLACLFYILMLFPSLYVNAADDNEAYKAGYSNGLWEGIDAAYSDLEDLKSKNYYKAMPKDEDIKSNYDLDKETASYRTSFLRGFKDGFREGYNNTYDNPKAEIKPTNYDEALGYQMGEVSGFSDFYAGKADKWANAVPSTTKIIEMFQLSKEPNVYKNNFVTNFKTKFQVGYETAYRKAKFEPFKTAIERGTTDGAKFGEILGSNHGRLDYYNGSTSEWDRNLPYDDEVKSIYLLSNDMDDYTKAFLSAFKDTYRIKYEEAYRAANVDYNALLFDKGYSNGKSIGLAKGERLAAIDLLMGKSNNQGRHNLSDKDIINEYKLFNENDRYREGFIGGFKEGVKTGYTTAYQNSSYEYSISKNETQIVPIGGAQVASGDNKMMLNIDKGIFYNDIIASIDKIMVTNTNIKIPSKVRFSQSSDFYSVGVLNSSEDLNGDKLIKLSFEYYGSQNGGIYMYVDNSWVYLPSKIDANSISTLINPKSINNQRVIYAVFIDNKAWNPIDLRGHWAKDEVIAYLRNGIAGVYGDSTFRPDAEISKAQILTYMSKVYNWNLKSTESSIEDLKGLNDLIEFEPYLNLAAYCVKNGYIKINEDNTLKFSNPVTYREVEQMMRLATGDKEFSWAAIAEKIIMNKDIRSKSYNSPDNYITRAEAVYMLFYLNK